MEKYIDMDSLQYKIHSCKHCVLWCLFPVSNKNALAIFDMFLANSDFSASEYDFLNFKGKATFQEDTREKCFQCLVLLQTRSNALAHMA